MDFSIIGEDYSETRGGPVAFSQGTLVIDLVKRDANSLIWRSVFRDNEKNNSRLAPNTIDFANSIADRRADSPDSRARSRELADKLRSLLGP